MAHLTDALKYDLYIEQQDGTGQRNGRGEKEKEQAKK
jgi:hypothetical protein